MKTIAILFGALLFLAPALAAAQATSTSPCAEVNPVLPPKRGTRPVLSLRSADADAVITGMREGVARIRATIDPQTGSMKAEFVPDNTVGGPGDKLHPNCIGYQAMGTAIDLGIFGLRAK